MEKKFNNPRKDDYRDEVIDIRRVTKVTKGGRHFTLFCNSSSRRRKR